MTSLVLHMRGNFGYSSALISKFRIKSHYLTKNRNSNNFQETLQFVQFNGLRNSSTKLKHEENINQLNQSSKTVRISEKAVRLPSGKLFDLNFSDAKTAFRSKSTMEIMRSILVFQLFSFKTIVNKHEEV